MPDLEAIRSGLSAFADAARCPLESWQARALDLATRTTVIVAPRQSGKSRSLGVLALWWAYRCGGQRVLIVSAGEEAARRLLGEVRRIAAGSPLLAGSVVDEQAGLLTLSNASEVRCVPASERQVRGWAVDLLLVDEAAMVADDLLLGAALPTTAARPDAKIVLASSAITAAGAFYDHAVRGERGGSEHVRTHRWALADCGWISPSTVAAARESMSAARFAAEYEGVFASGADALFTSAELAGVTVDYLLTPLAELRGPARLAAGIDWGSVHDRSVFTAIGRLPVPGRPVFGVACCHRWPEGFAADRVIEEVCSSEGHFQWVVAESNGLGQPLANPRSGLLWRRFQSRPAEAGGGVRRRTALVEEPAWLPKPKPKPRPAPRPPADRFVTSKISCHVTAESKAAAYSALRLLVGQERLLISASAEELLRELRLLRVDLSPGGTERIEASRGHDDCADSLALALLPYRRGGRAWSVRLAELAQSDRPVLAVPAALGGVPTAAAPSGLTVPRRPVWASVAGEQVTVPARLAADRERPSRALVDARRRVAAALHESNDQQEVHDG